MNPPEKLTALREAAEAAIKGPPARFALDPVKTLALLDVIKLQWEVLEEYGVLCGKAWDYLKPLAPSMSPTPTQREHQAWNMNAIDLQHMVEEDARKIIEGI